MTSVLLQSSSTALNCLENVDGNLGGSAGQEMTTYSLCVLCSCGISVGVCYMPSVSFRRS